VQNLSNLRQNFYNNLLDLSTDEGINASGKEDIFGCTFGRDSAITALKILAVHEDNPSLELLQISRKALLTLVRLQGKEKNIESGEEPGKFIHEFRKEKFEHLLTLEKPWYVYPDGFLRNYDSIDSTPLTLIAIYKYWQITGDSQFLISVLPAVEAGLNWIITFGDLDKDLFLEYTLDPERIHGGLSVQSWTDSKESLEDINGNLPKYPIAPVEAQAFAWTALRLWADYYLSSTSSADKQFGKKLLSQAKKLKKEFNDKFIMEDRGLCFAAQALDGNKNQIKTITANPLLCLWAVYKTGDKVESILDSKYIKNFVKRGFMDDLFVPDAGIRTMSSSSKTFNPNQDSYHNGSFWPMLNGLIIEGLENFGFRKEARELRQAAILPLLHFQTPIELYVKNGNQFLEYKNLSGQTSCKVQAWSAAAALDYLQIEEEV
jgi:glycogen debranching enzyme